MTVLQWPAVPPYWLEDWFVWRFTGASAATRPASAPASIPKWAWDALKWAEWRRNSVVAGYLLPRPEGIDPTIPLGYWTVLKNLNQRVPIRPPSPPPPLPPSPPPVWTAPPRPSVNQIWDSVGTKISTWTWGESQIDEHCAKFASQGGRYISLQTSNGLGRAPQDYVMMVRERCLAHHLIFCLWTVTYEHPEQEAQILVEDTSLYSPAGVAINAELYYHGNPGLGGEELVRWERNGRFLGELAKLGGLPNTAKALNTLGAAYGTNRFWMPHRQWIEAGFDVHAQAYYNYNDVYHPAHCVEHWLACEYPLERIELTLGCYQAEQSELSKGLHLHVDNYLPLLGGLGIKGVNLFYSEVLDDQRDLAQIPQLISRSYALS